VLKVIANCADIELMIGRQIPFKFFGSAGQAWHRVHQHLGLSDYILLAGGTTDYLQSVAAAELSTSNASRIGSSATRLAKADILTTDYCKSETEKCLEKWEELISERSPSITTDMVRFLGMLCAVNDAVAAGKGSSNVHRLNSLRSANTALAKALSSYVTRPDCDSVKFNALLEVVGQTLPSIDEIQQLQDPKDFQFESVSFALHVSKALQSQPSSKQSANLRQSDDLMDLDDGFDSQASGTKPKDDPVNVPREVVALSSDLTSYRICLKGYAQLLALLLGATAFEDTAGGIPDSFVEYLTSLSPSELCASRPLLELVFTSSMPLSSTSVEALIEHFAEVYLEVYEFERHEVALVAILDLLIGTSSQWTDAEQESLSDAATEVYSWFVNVALKNRVCSAPVEIRITELFFELLQVRGPDYKPSTSIPSVRTGLFGRLKEGPLKVKYCVSMGIPQFFDRFVLGEHESVFGDVYTSLPAESDWEEGIALRLLVLARLGAKWHTLLRRCLYHIFETAGLVPSSVGHASWCVKTLSTSLGLKEPQPLFQLFAPQLLYSWLVQQTIRGLPYAIFQYESLRELLEDCKEEIYAQVAMRGKEDEISVLTETFEASRKDLLLSSFARTTAYCLAWDADNSKDGSNKGETRIQTLLGKSFYTELFRTHHARILGLLLSKYEGDVPLKCLTAREDTKRPAAALKEMLGNSSSTQKLPAEQQPLHQTKNLMDKISRLCRRIGTDYQGLWSPGVFVYVLRVLLNRLHPALGSLHACSTVRKIRILVALAGPIALSGYPLEMTLHALQPLAVDKQCAEDTLGIMRYLLQRGLPHLVPQISFATSTVLSALVSLRKFVGSSQESTTQESHHRATMSKAQNFHTWLTKDWCVQYTRQYLGENKEDAKLKAFSAIVRSAAEARAVANAIEGTPESQLLRELLDDQRSGRYLLQGPRRTLLFNLLCSQFDKPPSYRQDILGLDALASSYAAEVWKSCRGSSVSDGYLLWSARVLGRAHIATGKVHELLQADSEWDDRVRDGKQDNGDPAFPSRLKIVNTLLDLLQSPNRDDACFAEETIRMALTRSAGVEALTDLTDLLPSTVLDALSLPTPDRIHPHCNIPIEPLQEALKPHEDDHVERWSRILAVALCSSETGDNIILPCLVAALSGVDGLAEKLLAPIIHLVLLGELEGRQEVRKTISEACKDWFAVQTPKLAPYLKGLLNTLLYLRKQPRNNEKAHTEWEKWIEFDAIQAAKAAEFCGMHLAALLFAETGRVSVEKVSRRSSISIPTPIPDDLLLRIYKSIDEPDSFYGVEQEPNLESVLSHLDYEANGMKSLLFRGAQMDSETRRQHKISDANSQGIVSSLSHLNMNSITSALLSSGKIHADGTALVDDVFRTAQKLGQWDIRPSERPLGEASTLYAVFQGLNNASDAKSIRDKLDAGFSSIFKRLLNSANPGKDSEWALRTLGILTEVDDATTSLSAEQLHDARINADSRKGWMLSAL
jgi:serine-protein kinase ATM